MTDAQQVAAIHNSIESASLKSSYKTLVVDSLGLNDDNYKLLLDKLQGFPKPVVVVR